MAIHKSAKTRIRRNARATVRNKARTSNIRGSIRKVEAAVAAGDEAAAKQALKEAQPKIARGVSKGVLHKNTASRKISRLAKRVKALKK